MQLPNEKLNPHELSRLAEGFSAIQALEVRRAGQLVQTIPFEGDDKPIFKGAWKEAVSLQDVDCDGYMDLLVRITVGVHGDAWYHLYLFNKAIGAFVGYPRFSSLPFVNVDCRTKLVTTYVNEGEAGCAYEKGTYRWVRGELVPVRIESQRTEGGRLTRLIRTWATRGEAIVKKSIEANHCHRKD